MFAPLFSLFSGLPPLITLTPLSLLLGVGMLWIFSLTSNQGAIRKVKARLQAHLYEMRLFPDEPVLIWKAQLGLLAANVRYIGLMLLPAIVAGVSGDVRIAWMDSRANEPGHADHPLWNTVYRSSTNGGASWSPETLLSSPARGYDYILTNGFRFPFGDYFGLAIDSDGATHAVWGEGSNYKSPGSIWYSRGR